MKERPILFSGAMVRAILDGRKTQTRRVVTRELKNPGWTSYVYFPPHPSYPDRRGVAIECGPDYPDDDSDKVYCPYGDPGDRLWVRESFWGCDAPGYGDTPCVVYDDEWHGKEYRPEEIRPWAPKFGRIPSIHMPRSCSRITLEVIGVRVERLQDISEDDARAEGAYLFPGEGGGWKFGRGEQEYDSAVEAYQHLWDSLNAERGFGWDKNPWIWIIEFKRV
ncbi:hypothetical protein VSR82_07640 [Burkholderia sp. JPY481]